MKRVSVVIPAYNEGKVIERCLKALKKQRYTDFEIIVVDNNSTDKTAEIARKYADRVLFSPKKGITYTKNIGIKAASGDLIASTDADCVPEPDWLEELVRHFDRENTASVGGPNLTPKDESQFGKSVGIVLDFLSRPGARYGARSRRVEATFHNPGCNVMHRKRLFSELGGFNTSLETCEDAEFDHRVRNAGYDILFNPKAVVYHYRRLSLGKFFKQAYRYALGRMQAIRLFPRMASWFHFVPVINTGIVAALFVLSFLSIKLYILLLFILFSEGLLLILLGLYLGLKNRVSYFPSVVILIAAWYAGWTYGTILGLFRDVRRNERGFIAA